MADDDDDVVECVSDAPPRPNKAAGFASEIESAAVDRGPAVDPARAKFFEDHLLQTDLSKPEVRKVVAEFVFCNGQRNAEGLDFETAPKDPRDYWAAVNSRLKPRITAVELEVLQAQLVSLPGNDQPVTGKSKPAAVDLVSDLENDDSEPAPARKRKRAGGEAWAALRLRYWGICRDARFDAAVESWTSKGAMTLLATCASEQEAQACVDQDRALQGSDENGFCDNPRQRWDWVVIRADNNMLPGE